MFNKMNGHNFLPRYQKPCIFKAFGQNPCISSAYFFYQKIKNRVSSRLLAKIRVSQVHNFFTKKSKTVYLQGFWLKSVYLKCYGIKIKTVYLQGLLSSRPYIQGLAVYVKCYLKYFCFIVIM